MPSNTFRSIMHDFQSEVAARISANATDEVLRKSVDAFMHASIMQKYSYNFAWQGRPMAQRSQLACSNLYPAGSKNPSGQTAKRLDTSR